MASLGAVVADLARTAVDGAVGQRHLQQAAATGSGIMDTLSARVIPFVARKEARNVC